MSARDREGEKNVDVLLFRVLSSAKDSEQPYSQVM